MDRDLEQLIVAYDAVLEARDSAMHQRLLAVFESRLEDVWLRHPNINRDSLRGAIRAAHRKWLAAQRKPPTLPP